MGKKSNKKKLVIALLIPGLILCLAFLTVQFHICCGGGDSSFLGEQDTTITELGIEFAHNDFYSEDELTEAILVVDEYLEMALDCVEALYPDLTDVIKSLPVEDLLVVVVHPDLYNPSTGQEGFTCGSSPTGCVGEYKVGKSKILITPSLDALGHEMTHWINDMLFGQTSDETPHDLVHFCYCPLICHLYSENRNLQACRE